MQLVLSYFAHKKLLQAVQIHFDKVSITPIKFVQSFRLYMDSGRYLRVQENSTRNRAMITAVQNVINDPEVDNMKERSFIGQKMINRGAI